VNFTAGFSSSVVDHIATVADWIKVPKYVHRHAGNKICFPIFFKCEMEFILYRDDTYKAIRKITIQLFGS